MRGKRVAEGRKIERGRPRRIANNAAREKLRTEVVDITADAKQRLNAFNKDAVEAEFLVVGCVGNNVIARGGKETNKAIAYDAS